MAESKDRQLDFIKNNAIKGPYLKHEDSESLEVKGWKKKYQANMNQNKVLWLCKNAGKKDS